MTKQKNISFIPYLSKSVIKDTISRHNQRLESIRTLLLSHHEDIDEAIEYQRKGVDWKRKETIKECEEYIKRTQMPEYLQGQALEAARASVDNDYIKRLAGAFGVLKFDLSKDVIATPEKWEVAQHIIDKVVADHTYTLTDKEMKLFARYKQMIEIAEELHKEYYFFGANLDYNDELRMQPTEAELAEQFVNCQRATPEQIAERQRKYGSF